MMKEPILQQQCVSLHTLKQYRQGSIADQKRQKVESHLSTCQLCTHALSGYPTINEREMEEDLASLKKNFKHKLLDKQTQKRRRSLYSLAAALAFLVTAAVAIQFFLNSTSPEQLYDQYYSSYEISDELNSSFMEATKAGSEEDADGIAMVQDEDGNIITPTINTPPRLSEPLITAIASYKNIPYDSNAIPTSFEQEPSEKAFIQLLNGVKEIDKGNTQAAIPILERVARSNTNYAADASWYLALAHLKLGESAKAIPYLDKLIALKKGDYFEKATALRGELK